MVTENEFWATVINTSANWVVAGAMVLQTIIFYVTFRLGFKELEKHKKKLKIENSYSISEKIIQNMYSINYTLEPIFENHNDPNVSDFLKREPYLDLPIEFEKIGAQLYYIENAIDECNPKLERLITEMQVWGDFLKDYETKEEIELYKSRLTDLLSEIGVNYLKVTMIEKNDLSNLGSNEKMDFIKKKREEWKDYVPYSLYDKNFPEVKNYHAKFDDLRHHLISKFVP